MVGDQPPRLLDAGAAARGIDAGERDEHVRAGRRRLGDLLVGHPGLSRRQLVVDWEDDRHHAPRAIVLGDVLRRRPGELAAEVPCGRFHECRRQAVVARARALGVRVDVDGDDVVQRRHHSSPQPPLRTTASPALASNVKPPSARQTRVVTASPSATGAENRHRAEPVEDAPGQAHGARGLLVEMDRVVVAGGERIALGLVGRHGEARLVRVAVASSVGDLGRGLSALFGRFQAAEQLGDVLLRHELAVDAGLSSDDQCGSAAAREEPDRRCGGVQRHAGLDRLVQVEVLRRVDDSPARVVG
jgi:hypothetical protein